MEKIWLVLNEDMPNEKEVLYWVCNECEYEEEA